MTDDLNVLVVSEWFKHILLSSTKALRVQSSQTKFSIIAREHI